MTIQLPSINGEILIKRQKLTYYSSLRFQITKSEDFSAFSQLQSEFAVEISRKLCLPNTMASSSSKVKKGSEMLVKGVEWKAPNFKIVLAVAETLDPTGTQSQTPTKVILI